MKTNSFFAHLISRYFAIVILITFLSKQKGYAQSVNITVSSYEVQYIQANNCDDCSSSLPDPRWYATPTRNSAYININDFMSAVQDEYLCPSNPWINPANSASKNWYFGGNVTDNVDMYISGFEEDGCNSNDNVCIGFGKDYTYYLGTSPGATGSTQITNVYIPNYVPNTQYYFSGSRICDKGTYLVKWAFTWNYSSYILPGSIALGNQCITANGNPSIINNASNGSPYISYQWQQSDNNGSTWIDIAGATGLSYDPPAGLLNTRQYRRKATFGNLAAQYSNAVTVNVFAPANAGPDVTACYGQNVSIGTPSISGYTYSWTPSPWLTAGNIAQPTVTYPNSNATLYLTATNTANGCSSTDGVNIFANPQMSTSVSTANSASSVLCNGQSVTLNSATTGGTAPYTYSWSSGATTANTTVSPNSTTSFVITATDSKGCTSNNSIPITVNPLPIADAGADKTACYEQDVIIGTTEISGYSYGWTPVPWVNDATLATPVVAFPYTDATLTLTVTDLATGCTANDNVTVFVNSEILSTLTANNSITPITICEGESVNLAIAATGGTALYTYSWSNGNTSASQSVSPTTTQTYSVTVTDAKGCTKTSSILVNVNPAPIVDAGLDKVLCYGTSQTIGTPAQSNYSYSWSPSGATTAQTTVSSLSANTTYTLIATNPTTGCTAQDNVVIGYNPMMVANITNNNSSSATVCAGTSVNLTTNVAGGTSPYTYSWNNASTNQVLALTPTTSALYNVTATDANGCTTFDDIQLTVNPLPTNNLGVDKYRCSGAVATVIGNNAVSGFSYSWYPTTAFAAGQSATTAKPSVSPTNTTTYNLRMTNNSTSCFKVDDIVVNVNAVVPTASISASSSSVCEGGTNITLTATATGAGYYQWYQGTTLKSSTTTPTYTIAASSAANTGTYSCKVKTTSLSTNTCLTTSNSLPITVSAAPVPTISPAGTSNVITFCGSTGGTLTTATTATNLSSWQWKWGTGTSVSTHTNVPGNSTTSSYANLQNNTYYSVLANYSNGCSRPSIAKKVMINLGCRQDNGDSTNISTDLPLENIKTYPNPVSDILTINLSNNKDKAGNLQLVNMLGQEVISKSVTLTEGENIIEWDLSQLSTGVYTLIFSSDTQRITQKVVKE